MSRRTALHQRHTCHRYAVIAIAAAAAAVIAAAATAAAETQTCDLFDIVAVVIQAATAYVIDGNIHVNWDLYH